MSDQLPWLSVIMPTFEGVRYVETALESVVAQATGHVLEVIVVDDGSTDGTVGVIESFASRLPVKLIRQSHGGSWVASTNVGMAQARGEFCCFLHQDDRWEPGRVEALAALRVAYPSAGVLVHPSRFVDPEGEVLGRWSLPFGRQREGMVAQHEVLERFLVQNFLAIPAPCFRRDVAFKAGPLEESLWFLADWDFWARLCAVTEVAVCPEPLAAFRVHPASQTACRTHDETDLRAQYAMVTERVSALLGAQRDAVGGRRARRAGALNVELSLVLAALHHGRRPSWGRLLGAMTCCSVPAWRRFWRDSCIVERVQARIRMNRRGVA